MTAGADWPVAGFRRRQPRPELQAALQAQGVAPVLARVLAARLRQVPDWAAVCAARLDALPNPDAIPDMPLAVARILRAVQRREQVVFAVDHDMDGQASAAVLWTAFTAHFGVDPDLLRVVSSHRLREGYGLTEAVVERILEAPPGLVISADKGSTDEPRIAQLAATGVDVIVTDHHGIPPEGPPASALACVNPGRSDSAYDPTICGAAVAFFCMARVRQALLATGAAVPSLAPLLDYVAVATIADCVSLCPDRAPINQTLVRQGLRRINAGLRPCWQVFAARREDPVDAEAIAFGLAPAVAAAGRLDWAEPGFAFLTAADRPAAEAAWAQLQSENEARKQLEARVRAAALEQLAAEPLPAAACVFLEDGHSGVHGITASRLVERLGRPAAVFAPRGQGARAVDGTGEADEAPDVEALAAPGGARDDGESATQKAGGAELLSASLRGVPGLHLRETLAGIAAAQPGLLRAWGGHAAAAGLSLARADYPRFKAAFIAACGRQLAGQPLRPEHCSDGPLAPEEISLDTVDALATADPWGREFEAPLFDGVFTLRSQRAVGDGSHRQLELDCGGRTLRAIWFRATEAGGGEIAPGEALHLLYALGANTWRGQRRLQLRVVARIPEGALPAD